MPRGTSPQHLESMMFDYLADALEPDARREFEELLADSPEWQRRVERERTLERNLHSTAAAALPAGVAERIKANVKARLAVPIATAQDDPNAAPGTAKVIDVGGGAEGARSRAARQNSGRGMLLLAASLVIIMAVVVSRTGFVPEGGKPKLKPQRQQLATALTGNASHNASLNATDIQGRVAQSQEASPRAKTRSMGDVTPVQEFAAGEAGRAAEDRLGEVTDDAGRDRAVLSQSVPRKNLMQGNGEGRDEEATREAMRLDFKREWVNDEAAKPTGGTALEGATLAEAEAPVVEADRQVAEATPTRRPTPVDTFNVSPLKPQSPSATAATRGRAAGTPTSGTAKEDLDQMRKLAEASGPAPPTGADAGGDSAAAALEGRLGQELSDSRSEKELAAGVGGGEASGEAFGLSVDDAEGAAAADRDVGLLAFGESNGEPLAGVPFEPPSEAAARRISAAPAGAFEKTPSSNEASAVDLLVEALEAGGLHVLSRDFDAASGTTAITVSGLEGNLTRVLRPEPPAPVGTNEAATPSTASAGTPYSFFASQSEVWSAETYLLAADAATLGKKDAHVAEAPMPSSYGTQIKGGARHAPSASAAEAPRGQTATYAGGAVDAAAAPPPGTYVGRRALYPDELPFLRVVWDRTEVDAASQIIAGMMSNDGSRLQNFQAFYESQAETKEAADQPGAMPAGIPAEMSADEWARINEEYQTSAALSSAPPVAQTYLLRVTPIVTTK